MAFTRAPVENRPTIDHALSARDGRRLVRGEERDAVRDLCGTTDGDGRERVHQRLARAGAIASAVKRQAVDQGRSGVGFGETGGDAEHADALEANLVGKAFGLRRERSVAAEHAS
jgi:hypothetical protein